MCYNSINSVGNEEPAHVPTAVQQREARRTGSGRSGELYNTAGATDVTGQCSIQYYPSRYALIFTPTLVKAAT